MENKIKNAQVIGRITSVNFFVTVIILFDIYGILKQVIVTSHHYINPSWIFIGKKAELIHLFKTEVQ
jgi:hypothetical protein